MGAVVGAVFAVAFGPFLYYGQVIFLLLILLIVFNSNVKRIYKFCFFYKNNLELKHVSRNQCFTVQGM